MFGNLMIAALIVIVLWALIIGTFLTISRRQPDVQTQIKQLKSGSTASKRNRGRDSAMKRAYTFWWLSLVIVAVLAAGCRSTNAEPDTCDDPPQILFFDDFNGEQDCGWATYNRGGGIAAIENARCSSRLASRGKSGGRTRREILTM